MSTAPPNHRRGKPGAIKPGVNMAGVTGPTSQIPGLSQSAETDTPVERISGRRVGIFESDSEYVKLAKGGGLRGLLSHDVDADDGKPTKSYKVANFFGGGGDDNNESRSGSKATLPDGQARAPVQPLTAPFGTDSSASWESETDTALKTPPDDVTNQLEGLNVSSKYKRTSFEKKAAPVSMSKLLSHGYVEEKKKSPNDDDSSSVTSEQTSTVATEDVDDLE